MALGHIFFSQMPVKSSKHIRLVPVETLTDKTTEGDDGAGLIQWKGVLCFLDRIGF
jgi:hypothetical protein